CLPSGRNMGHASRGPISLVTGVGLPPSALTRRIIGVIERGYRVGLAFETLKQLRAVLDIMSEDFDGDGALQPGVAGAVHFTHTPGTERRENLMGAQPGSTGKGHCGTF